AGGPATVGVTDRAAFIDVCVPDVSGVLRLGGGCEARRQIVLNRCNEALFRGGFRPAERGVFVGSRYRGEQRSRHGCEKNSAFHVNYYSSTILIVKMASAGFSVTHSC